MLPCWEGLGRLMRVFTSGGREALGTEELNLQWPLWVAREETGDLILTDGSGRLLRLTQQE
ncbi:MAG: hypothetical protein Q6L60_05100 [Thermostichus sp. HHBFW_bins_43]